MYFLHCGRKKEEATHRSLEAASGALTRASQGCKGMQGVTCQACAENHETMWLPSRPRAPPRASSCT
eukprot:6182106-Pleurochrysis_carterae.AAC.2